MTRSHIPLSSQLLIALPSLPDPNFARSLALICQHDSHGAMAILVNRSSEYTLGEVFEQMGIRSASTALCKQIVYAGGPVHPERGFVIHDGPQRWDSSLTISEDLCLTTSRDVLEAVAEGKGPQRLLVALGCAGWGQGQLEMELGENNWLMAPVNPKLIFDVPIEQRWQLAANSIGVDLFRLTGYAGHA